MSFCVFCLKVDTNQPWQANKVSLEWNFFGNGEKVVKFMLGYHLPDEASGSGSIAVR